MWKSPENDAMVYARESPDKEKNEPQIQRQDTSKIYNNSRTKQ